MKKLSQDAGLTTIYTNHCLRASTVTFLKRQGVSNSEICSLTGHKQEVLLITVKSLVILGNVSSLKCCIAKGSHLQKT